MLSQHLHPEAPTLRSLDEAIVEKLRKDGPCCFDEVVTSLPNFSWAQMFVAIDCMSRDGRVFLRKLGYSAYQISLGSQPAHSANVSQMGQVTSKDIPIAQMNAQ
jgi:hypothetical protein